LFSCSGHVMLLPVQPPGFAFLFDLKTCAVVPSTSRLRSGIVLS
jgi:hypothetical protein